MMARVVIPNTRISNATFSLVPLLNPEMVTYLCPPFTGNFSSTAVPAAQVSSKGQIHYRAP